MEQRNVVSVSWGDHMTFGEGDGRLATLDAVRRRMERWRDDLNAAILHWRLNRAHVKGHYYAARGRKHSLRAQDRNLGWDFFEIVPQFAHRNGLKAYLYVSLFDEGWPLPPRRVREVSYHNAMHHQHISWQTAFSREHPEYALADRTGKQRQWGVLCLAHPEVRSHFCSRFMNLLQNTEFDGLFVCLRSQSRPADFADQFGFNQPVRDDFLKRYGKDIWKEDFEIARWRDLLGEYVTVFLADLKKSLDSSRTLLAVGAPRGNILGPPFGNITLQWETWVEKEIVDHLIIDQKSSNCPSMWHDLWPMHRGYGYRQNYLDGFNMNPLQEDLTSVYQPACRGHNTELYLARQWRQRSPDDEQALLENPCVEGLVFSSFRHDNPGPVRRNDWNA